MSLAIALPAEILKTKRTASFYLTGLAAAFEPAMSMIDIFIGEGFSSEQGLRILNHMLTERFQMTGLLGLPIFIILICTLLPQIEYKNNAWKQVFASPQSKGDIFFAKFINVHMLVVIYLLINFALTFLGTVILHFRVPSINVLSQPVNWAEVVMVRLNTYIALLGLLCIQFWMGLRFRNFIVPIGIGILLWFVGTLMVVPIKSPAALYFPYSFQVYANFKEVGQHMRHGQMMSCIYAVVAVVLGYWDFSRRMKR